MLLLPIDSITRQPLLGSTTGFSTGTAFSGTGQKSTMLLQGAQEPRAAAAVASDEGVDVGFQVPGMEDETMLLAVEDETLLLAVEALRNAKIEATLPAGAKCVLVYPCKKKMKGHCHKVR